LFPMQIIQTPQRIVMLYEYMNVYRVIPMNAKHPDDMEPSYMGDSVGHWEGNTLVVDTKYFPGHHHWMDQGGASIPASDQLHIVERIRMINSGKVLEIEYTMTDPKSWEGDWKMTKRWNRVDDDITEVECWPDLNDHIRSTSSSSQIR